MNRLFKEDMPRRSAEPKRETYQISSKLLQNSLVKYGSVLLGVIIFYLVFLRKDSKKSAASTTAAPGGPTIVDVTETSNGGGSDDNTKSVKSSINRVSSPRIVFGDLRKNPSLMVAPPMTPAVASR